MFCSRCNMPIEDGIVFCGNCGNQVAPINAPGATLSAASPTELRPVDSYPRPSVDVSYKTEYTPQQVSGASPTPSLRSSGYHQDFAANGPSSVTPPTAMPPLRNRNTYIAFIAALIVVLIVAVSAGTLALINHNSINSSTNTPNNNTPSTPVGAGAPVIAALVSFNDSNDVQGVTNTLTIKANGLNAPPAGSQYHAWLVDATNEERLTNLGTLNQQGQGYVLTFKGGSANLLGVGNKIIVTQEQGDPLIPAGTTILSGTFPAQAFVHIKHLLLAFPSTPQHQGLLVGLLDQAQKVNASALLLKGANGNRTIIRCASQSIIDILEGTQGPHYQQLPFNCGKPNISEIGDGFGLLGDGHYIKLALAHAALASGSPDATQLIKLHASHVAIALNEDLLPWYTTIDEDAQALLNNPDNTDGIAPLVTLSDHAYNGVDLDNDEQVDPVKGEAGAKTAYQHGQLMATLQLSQ